MIINLSYFGKILDKQIHYLGIKKCIIQSLDFFDSFFKFPRVFIGSLSGQSVDLVAKTTGLRIEKGDSVVIEEVDGDVAYVSRAPDELQP